MFMFHLISQRIYSNLPQLYILKEWHDVSKNKKSDLEKNKNKRQETLGWRMAERKREKYSDLKG